MAKAKPAFPFDLITGVLVGIDRTIGRDGGFMSGIRKLPIISAADAAAGLILNLTAPKAPSPRTSARVHEKGKGYCDCDCGFKTIGEYKRSRLNPWWRLASAKPDDTTSGYTIWMKICLKRMEEKRLFEQYSYCTRYHIWNTDTTTWTDHPVLISEIPTRSDDHTDLEAFVLLGSSEMKGTIKYDTKMIDGPLEISAAPGGIASVIIPNLQPEASVLVDVYSYDPDPI